MQLGVGASIVAEISAPWLCHVASGRLDVDARLDNAAATPRHAASRSLALGRGPC